MVPSLSAEQLTEVLALVKKADSVELKVSVADTDQQSAVKALGMDVIDAQIRQIAFFDTPDLKLNDAGVVVRARRVQRKPADSVVKLRPVVPSAVPAALRKSASFGIEVDAMPNGFVCSASMKGTADDGEVKSAFAGHLPLPKLLSKEQRSFFADHAPAGITLDALTTLGPLNILKLKFTPPEYGRRLVAELWFYPDGKRILELSTKATPGEAFEVAAATKAFLAAKRIDLFGKQQTKTKAALNYFARHLDTNATARE
jgi:hypothetical protein